MRYKRAAALVLVALMAAMLSGCVAREVSGGEPTQLPITAAPTPVVTPEPTLRPETVLPLGDESDVVSFDVSNVNNRMLGETGFTPAYKKTGYFALDIEKTLDVLFDGQKYELVTGEGYEYYEVKRSKNGRFRERVSIDEDNSFFYDWDRNEHYPSGKVTHTPEEALSYMEDYAARLLGEGVPFDIVDRTTSFDEDGNPSEPWEYSFMVYQLVDGLRAGTMSVYLKDEGVTRIYFNFLTLENINGYDISYDFISPEDALHCFNYARQTVGLMECSSYADDIRITDVGLELSRVFAGEEDVFTPVYAITHEPLRKAGAWSVTLVDAYTGCVWNDHDGYVGSPYIEREFEQSEMYGGSH